MRFLIEHHLLHRKKEIIILYLLFFIVLLIDFLPQNSEYIEVFFGIAFLLWFPYSLYKMHQASRSDYSLKFYLSLPIVPTIQVLVSSIVSNLITLFPFLVLAFTAFFNATNKQDAIYLSLFFFFPVLFAAKDFANLSLLRISKRSIAEEIAPLFYTVSYVIMTLFFFKKRFYFFLFILLHIAPLVWVQYQIWYDEKYIPSRKKIYFLLKYFLFLVGLIILCRKYFNYL